MPETSSTSLPAIPVTLVRDLMTEVVETLRVGDSLNVASHLMQAGRIRHLPVIDEQEHLVGLVTHRKILEVWASHGRPYREPLDRIAAEIPVDMLMVRNVLTVSPDTSAALAAELMEASKFGCLPVLDHGKLVGIVTESDFVRFARKFFEGQIQDRRQRRARRRPS